ncbi:hypothetical protein EV715DRAFT_258258 [Schizophyllum commune]
MDAHIFPGAKMPVFEVRKSMQERYSVDRRNIYDYFHSRGLRVSKEDKHQNLVRSRKAAAAKTAPATGTPPPASTTAPSTEPNKRRKVGPRPSLRHYASTPFPSAKNSTPSSTSSKDNTSAPLASCPLPTRTAVPSRLSDASGRTEAASPASLMQRLAATRSEPVLVPDYSSSSAKPAVVEIALPFDKYGRYVEDSSASVDDTAAEDFDLSTISTLFDPEADVPTTEHQSSLVASTGSLTPGSLDSTVESHGRSSLSKEERYNIYNMISNAVGPARGMQESLGSYKSYMDERTRLYNEKLRLSSQSSAWSTKVLPASQTPLSPVLSTNARENRISAPPVFVPTLAYPPSPPPFLSSHSISGVPPLLTPSPVLTRHHSSPQQSFTRERIFQYPLSHMETASDFFSSNAALHWA